MITTRDINVDLSRGKRPLSQKTTKDVDVYVKPGKPKPTRIAVSTHNIESVQAIAEKKRRDKIAKQREKGIKIITAPAIIKDKEGNLISTIDEQKKLANKEKMAKVRAAKGKKK